MWWESECSEAVPTATVVMDGALEDSLSDSLFLLPMSKEHIHTQDPKKWTCYAAILHGNPGEVVGCAKDTPVVRMAVAAFLDSLDYGGEPGCGSG